MLINAYFAIRNHHLMHRGLRVPGARKNKNLKSQLDTGKNGKALSASLTDLARAVIWFGPTFGFLLVPPVAYNKRHITTGCVFKFHRGPLIHVQRNATKLTHNSEEAKASGLWAELSRHHKESGHKIIATCGSSTKCLATCVSKHQHLGFDLTETISNQIVELIQ